MPPDPSRVERPSGLRQIYPPVTFKYPLAQKLIETPGIVTFDLLVYFPPITLSYYNDIPEFIMFDFNKIVEMESPNFERKEVKAQE